MKRITIGKNESGQRVDRFLLKAFPSLPSSAVCKAARKKDIKINGRHVDAAYKLCEGDELTVYIKDELLGARKTAGEAFLSASAMPPVVYEDENILLVDKPAGLPVHEDDDGTSDTLIARIQAYLYKKGEYDPEGELCFAPALCNRIDRNTGGIVIAAKNAEALRIMNRKIRDRELKKYYLCAVSGVPGKKEATLTAYLFKNEKENRVIISDKKTPKNKTIVTKYRVIAENSDGDSLLEVELITGRTHQIRAHMAYIGHPLLGDGKYGSNRVNKLRGYTTQALCSYKLVFSFTTDAGILSYLDGKEFKVGRVPFLEKFERS